MFCEPERDASTVASFAAELETHEGNPAAVEAVTYDLSPAFAKGVSEHLPDAKRVADRFHVVQIASRQVDRVRVAESRESKKTHAALQEQAHMAQEGGRPHGAAGHQEARAVARAPQVCLVKLPFRKKARVAFGSARATFSGSVTGAPLACRLAEHEALLEPSAGAAELDEPAVVHDPVHDRGGELVVREGCAPPAEPCVRGGHDAPPLT